MLMQYLNSGVVEAGCDEAGRGCLAGPVYAAAVILPPNYKNDLLNDSKQLSEHQRDALRPIIERDALAWCVGVVSPEEIDHINILKASFLAMHRAIKGLKIEPQHLLIDGNRFTPYPGIPHTCIVKALHCHTAIGDGGGTSSAQPHHMAARKGSWSEEQLEKRDGGYMVWR